MTHSQQHICPDLSFSLHFILLVKQTSCCGKVAPHSRKQNPRAMFGWVREKSLWKLNKEPHLFWKSIFSCPVSHKLTLFNPELSESQLPRTFCLLMSSPLPCTSPFLTKNTDLTEHFINRKIHHDLSYQHFSPAFCPKVCLCSVTESSSSAQLPVCVSVRTSLTSYSTSRCLSSLLLFGSGSGSVDLKSCRRTRGQPCGLGHRSCCIPPLGVLSFSLQCVFLPDAEMETQRLFHLYVFWYFYLLPLFP